MPERRRFYKAVTTDLSGPHYGGLTYLPGTHHALGLNDPFDSDPNGWCTAGLYVTSHRRVAARWGPVVIEVLKDEGAPLVKTTQRHKPTGVPSGIDSGSYAKYRTTGFTVLCIVGVVGHGPNMERSKRSAQMTAMTLNQTLDIHGKQPVTFLDQDLERLRDDGYRLWAVEDPNVVTVKGHPGRPPVVRHRVEIEFEATRQLTEAEIMDLATLRSQILPGSQRIVSLR